MWDPNLTSSLKMVGGPCDAGDQSYLKTCDLGSDDMKSEKVTHEVGVVVLESGDVGTDTRPRKK